jgi:hypothetical protein
MSLVGGPGARPERPRPGAPRRDPVPGSTDRATLWVLLALHVALEATLVAAGWTLVKYLPTMPLAPFQKVMFEVGLAAAFVAFGLRGLALWRRLRRGGPATRG